MIIVVSGWRDWTDQDFIATTLDGINWFIDEYDAQFRVGDATGVDTIFVGLFEDRQIPHTIWRADWDRFGKSAGPIRNREMITGQPHPEGSLNAEYEGPLANMLMAFPQPGSRPGTGSGTWGCIGEAWDAGVEVVLPGYPARRRKQPKE